MYLCALVLTLLLFGFAAWADDQADRTKLAGAWGSQDEAAKHASWTFEFKGDSLHMKYSEGSQVVTDFECTTKGRDCDAKVGGGKATVSLWFNGPKLVELETKGQEIVKRRFAIAGQGDQMEVEVMPIAPGGKTETLHFKRGALSASSH
jgi:hypothetical protein